MNRQELVEAIAGQTEVSKAAVNRMLDAMIDHIQTAVAGGEQVRLAGFGTFERTEMAKRIGRNPRSGSPIEIPPTIRPRFVPGAAFKSAVKGRGLGPKNIHQKSGFV